MTGQFCWEKMSTATEKVNIQINQGQTIYKNRTSTHSLQQQAQETNSLIHNKQPRKPASCKSDLQEARLLSSDILGS